MQTKDLFAHYKYIQPHANAYLTGLKLSNSLKGSEVMQFVPLKGRQVKFYYCGPTVYSHSHLGHARTYLGIDVIRRTLRDYLGYDLISVMNITDIDDKIITGANQAKLEFLKFTKIWEKNFFESMEALNVELPDVITRVSDYIPEIIAFTQKIIANGYAYESNGSVYFDVQNYQKEHSYPKMRPNINQELLNEAEGTLTQTKEAEKKNEQDFVLWKRSKPEEPKWNSPWGEGRPGWHIECSVMASEILGEQIDLHAGGIDLIFPHHDNSLAQSEACFKCDQWINYFIHLGHLNIEGLKMSKSLKNFITIEEVLKRYTARQVRLNFAIHQYDAVMNYSEQAMSEAIAKDRSFMEFFQNAKVYLRLTDICDNQKWNADDFQLNQLFRDKKQLIHDHILNNFNFPNVMKELEELVNQVNVQMGKKLIKGPLLQGIVQYVQMIFSLLGLNYQKDQQKNVEPIMDAVCQLRDQVRTKAMKGDFAQIQEICSQANMQYQDNLVNNVVDIFNKFRKEVLVAAEEKSKGQLFQLCDKIRDDWLMDLGLKIEDRNESSIWKQYDPADLKLEKEQNIKLKLQKEEEQKKKEQLKLQKEQELLNKAKIDPREMFKGFVDKYSEFDENGVPTKDQNGKELSQKVKHKLQLEWNKQNELFQKHKQ